MHTQVRDKSLPPYPASDTLPDIRGDAGVPDRLDWISLSAIAAVHVFLLAAIVISGTDEIRPHIEPPAVVGVLVSESTPPAPKAPKPLPVERPKPNAELRVAKQRTVKPRPMPAPAFKPALAVPSEHAISAPPSPSTSKTEEAAIAPPAPAAPTAVPASEAITPPRTDAKALNNPEPIYPPVSRRLGEHGRVELDIYILADGSVGEIKLKRSSGYDRLDQSAMDAVRRWHYIPAHKGNQPIPYRYVQPVSFGFKD